MAALVTKWVIMRNEGTDPDEETAVQIYGDKFLEYDKAWWLAEWLNRRMEGCVYWLKEIQE